MIPTDQKSAAHWAQKCARPGCGHTRGRHTRKPNPGCGGINYRIRASGRYGPSGCQCPYFLEEQVST
jgi:hypothetical protein